MAESKRRARKAKIQLREFVDEIPNSVLQISDDEENLLVDPVEEAPSSSTKPAPTAILKKIRHPSSENLHVSEKRSNHTLLDHDYISTTRSPSRQQIEIEPTQPRQQSAPLVSIQVEVEEVDEKKMRRERTIDSFQIEFNNMYTIADSIYKKSSNIADKYLSIELKNVWGRALRYKHDADAYETMIQSALHSWSYTESYRKDKESPLFYQCLICYKAWWFLEPFREHIRCHDAAKLKVYFLENSCETFFIASYHMSLSPVYFSCQGDCYRCGNPYSFHVKPNKHPYICEKCNMDLPRCTATWIHQLVCKGNRHESYTIICNICSGRFNSNEDLQDHSKKFHIVRSDIVVTDVIKNCAHCQQPYLLFPMHICTRHAQSCQYCYRMFPTPILLKVHVEMGRKSHCKICNILLDKNCMETQHMLTHTENFRLVYKCTNTLCPPTTLFKDELSVRHHNFKEHRRRPTAKCVIQEKILVPRLCMEEELNNVIRFVDYNKSTNCGEDDWCISEEEGQGRAYQISDHVIVKEELQEMEGRESVSESDEEGEMDYAKMLSKIFNVTTDEPHKKTKKPAKVQNRPSNSIQSPKEIEPMEIKTEPDTDENQIPEMNVNKSKVQPKIVPKPSLMGPSRPKQAVKQYENPTRKNLPKISQVQSMASVMEPATTQIQPSTSKIQPSTSEIQPKTFKINVSASHIVISSTSQNQSNASKKPITVISKVKQIKKSTLESQPKYGVVQNEQIDQPEIKAEPIDFDEMDIGDDPITIKEEPIEACLGSSYSTAYFNTENDNGQTFEDHNDSGQRNNTDSTRTWSNSNQSDNQNDSQNFMLDGQSVSETIELKHEPSDDESQENIDFNDELNVANLLAVKMEPEDVRDELMNGDEFGINDDVGDARKSQSYDKTNTFRPQKSRIRKKITLLSSTEDGNMKLKKILKIGNSLTVFEKELEKSTPLSTSDSSAESKKDKKYDTDESQKGIEKKKRKYKSHVKFDSEGNRLRKFYECFKCGYTQTHKLYQLHKKSHCKYSPHPDEQRESEHQTDTDNETKKRRRVYHNETKKRRRVYHNETDYGSKGLYHCTKCNVKYSSFRQYLLHFTKHGYAAYDCPVCDDGFDSLMNLVSHFHKHVRRNYVKCWMITDDKPDQDARKLQKCVICRSVVDTDDFFQHFESHVNLNSNKFGSKRNSNVSILPTHSNKDQGKEDLLNVTVAIDVESFGVKNTKKLSPTRLSEALKQLKGVLSVRDCRICGRNFSRRHDIKRHSIEHLLQDAYAKKDSLPTNSLRCQLCQEDFTKADLYKFHMREHGALPVYRCELCDKTFSDSSNFAKHKKIHNMRVLSCDICNKKFHVKSAIEKHMIMHMTLGSIHCKHCNKKFHSPSQYKKHLRVMHEQPGLHFKCHQCDGVFHSLKEKWDHAWEAHGDRKYKADCPTCGLQFRKYSQVKNHAREEHDAEVRRDKRGVVRIKPRLEVDE